MPEDRKAGKTVCSRCGREVEVPGVIEGAWSIVCTPCLDAGAVKLRGATRRVRPKLPADVVEAAPAKPRKTKDKKGGA